jgi:hypothetical protein
MSNREVGDGSRETTTRRINLLGEVGTHVCYGVLLLSRKENPILSLANFGYIYQRYIYQQ